MVYIFILLYLSSNKHKLMVSKQLFSTLLIGNWMGQLIININVIV